MAIKPFKNKIRLSSPTMHGDELIEDAPWYNHEEVGYNYRISKVIAEVVRWQFPRLEEHIARKIVKRAELQQKWRGECQAEKL